MNQWNSIVPLVLRDLTIEEWDAPIPSEEELVAVYLEDETDVENQSDQPQPIQKRRREQRAGPPERDLTYEEPNVPLAYPPTTLDM